MMRSAERMAPALTVTVLAELINGQCGHDVAWATSSTLTMRKPKAKHGPGDRVGPQEPLELSAYARGPIRLLRQGAVLGVNDHRAPTWSSSGRAPAPDG
jgi:hypothetical protein